MYGTEEEYRGKMRVGQTKREREKQRNQTQEEAMNDLV